MTARDALSFRTRQTRSRTAEERMEFCLPMFALLILSAALSISVAGPAVCDTLRVPSEYPTIQGAVDSAVPGDVIIVGPGTYDEAIDYLGKDVAVISAKGPSVTTIAGPAEKSLVTFRNGETESAVLDGFTLTGGTGTVLGHDANGGAVLCIGSSPTLIGNRYIENRAPALTLGGAIYCERDAAPRILDSEFVGNEAIVQGGAIACRRAASTRVENCRFVDNRNDAIYVFDSDLSVTGSTFDNNFGNGIRVQISESGAPRDFHIEGNRFTRNTLAMAVLAPATGNSLVLAENVIESNDVLGFRIHCADALLERNVVVFNRALPMRSANEITGGTARFRGNVIAWNRADNSALELVGDSTSVTFLHDTIAANNTTWQFSSQFGTPIEATNSIVWSRTGAAWFGEPPTFRHCLLNEPAPIGENNIVGDPLFVDVESDLHLRIESPAVDAAAPDVEGSPEFDVDGDARAIPGRPGREAVPDIGADEMRPELAARYGTVDAGTPDAIADVLVVNGSSGSLASREVRLLAGESLRIDMLAPPAGPATAPFALYAWIGESSVESIVEQPGGVGWTAFGTPVQGVSPAAIWNNIGRFGRLGTPTRPSTPAPSLVVNVPPGLPAGTIVTLQGYITDDGSAATQGASVTNAVVLVVSQEP